MEVVVNPPVPGEPSYEVFEQVGMPLCRARPLTHTDVMYTTAISKEKATSICGGAHGHTYFAKGMQDVVPHPQNHSHLIMHRIKIISPFFGAHKS
jgi:hypothetical protein